MDVRDSSIRFRVSTEQRKMMITSAHMIGASLTEVCLYSMWGRFRDTHLNYAKRFQLMLDDLSAGEAYDECQKLLRIQLDRAEYFQGQIEGLEGSHEMFMEIEGLTAYRDLLREEVGQT
jgi:hypothetical protein